MMRMLVSVRDEDEALAAAAAGADFIDLKEPREGALGGLAPERIRAVVVLLRRLHPGVPVSATIGDFAADKLAEIEAQVAAVGACGVDYVKVGVAANDRDIAVTLLRALAKSGHRVVPVFIVDGGLDLAVVTAACELPFPGLMVDTQDKLAGSLFEAMPAPALARFVALARGAGKLAGLAGALREADLERLAALAPDFAGFRSAVCAGERTARLDPGRVQRLKRALREVLGAAVV